MNDTPKYSELSAEQKTAWLAWHAEVMESDLARWIKRRLEVSPPSI